jgi:hypothetical protein
MVDEIGAGVRAVPVRRADEVRPVRRIRGGTGRDAVPFRELAQAIGGVDRLSKEVVVAQDSQWPARGDCEPVSEVALPEGDDTAGSK